MEPNYQSLLLAACALVMGLISLIPPQHMEQRKAACEIVLNEIADQTEVLLGQTPNRH